MTDTTRPPGLPDVMARNHEGDPTCSPPWGPIAARRVAVVGFGRNHVAAPELAPKIATEPGLQPKVAGVA